ncbi:hypothetical protein BKA67DRAFT_573488 [Truncatella angustata]|uniref:Uncharacterized protein n=1 Tax=Truncatella angustata TaxID=152316 RepID=A0A9P8UHF9_9PEZI|nr:uncharacterized protein BKA67DRAFT_573488 [Truncatella angustata]KAH6652284.1 hypothetical protein BKA67DRAFT_573488 [Truncatella angustata]KAH8196603.1 hypothetical protein TruAng_009229 [Truncatella angustata]
MTTIPEAVHHLEAEAINVLEDYKIRHSSHRPEKYENTANNTVIVAGVEREAQPVEFNSTLAPHPLVPYPVTNPTYWPQSFRQVPDYRPINTRLDWDERRQNTLFTVVGTIMICGCWMEAVASTVWRNTIGGYINITAWRIGGEW